MATVELAMNVITPEEKLTETKSLTTNQIPNNHTSQCDSQTPTHDPSQPVRSLEQTYPIEKTAQYVHLRNAEEDTVQEKLDFVKKKEKAVTVKKADDTVILDDNSVPQACQQVDIVADDNDAVSDPDVSPQPVEVQNESSPEPSDTSAPQINVIWSIGQEHSYEQKLPKDQKNKEENKNGGLPDGIEKTILMQDEAVKKVAVSFDLHERQSCSTETQHICSGHGTENQDHGHTKTVSVPQILKIQTPASNKKYHIHSVNDSDDGSVPQFLTLQGNVKLHGGAKKTYRSVQVLKLPSSPHCSHPHFSSGQIDHNLKPLQIQHNLGLESKGKSRSVLRLEGMHLRYDDRSDKAYYHRNRSHSTPTPPNLPRSPCRAAPEKFMLKDAPAHSPQVADNLSDKNERVGTDAVYMDIAPEPSTDDFFDSMLGAGSRYNDGMLDPFSLQNLSVDQYLPDFTDLPQFQNIPLDMEEDQRCAEPVHLNPSIPHNVITYNWQHHQQQQLQQHQHQHGSWYDLASNHAPYPFYSSSHFATGCASAPTHPLPNHAPSIISAHPIPSTAAATCNPTSVISENTAFSKQNPAYVRASAIVGGGGSGHVTTDSPEGSVKDNVNVCAAAKPASYIDGVAINPHSEVPMDDDHDDNNDKQIAQNGKDASCDTSSDGKSTSIITAVPLAKSTAVTSRPPTMSTVSVPSQITPVAGQSVIIPGRQSASTNTGNHAPSHPHPIPSRHPPLINGSGIQVLHTPPPPTHQLRSHPEQQQQQHVVSVTTLMPVSAPASSVTAAPSQPVSSAATPFAQTNHLSSAFRTGFNVDNHHQPPPIMELGRNCGGGGGGNGSQSGSASHSSHTIFPSWDESGGMMGGVGCCSTFLSPPPSVEQIASQCSTPCPTDSNESGYMTMEERDLQSPGNLYWQQQQQRYQDSMMGEEGLEGSGYNMMNSHLYPGGPMGCGGDYYGNVGMSTYPYTHQDSQYQTLHQTATDCPPSQPPQSGSSTNNNISGSNEIIYYPFNDLMQLHPSLMSGGEHDVNIQYVDPYSDPYSQSYSSNHNYPPYSQANNPTYPQQTQPPATTTTTTITTKRRGRGGRPRGSRNGQGRGGLSQIQSSHITSSLHRQMQQQQVKIESGVTAVGAETVPQKRPYRRRNPNPEGATQVSTPPKRSPRVSTRSSSTDSQEDRSQKGRHNEPLNQHAIGIMYEWYRQHEDNPYPTKEEKEVMAREGAITTMQVKSWFANKRNRSNNTRPKVQKRAMEEKLLQIYNRLSRTEGMGGPNAGQDGGNSLIIKELSQIISNRFDPDTSESGN